MKKLVLVLLALTLVSGLLAQDGPRPELSRKEVKQYHKSLEKLNTSLKKKTSKLKELLQVKSDTSVNIVNSFDSSAVLNVKTRDSLAADVFDQVEKLQDNTKIDSLGAALGMSEEIDRLKKELKIGMQMSKADPKMANKLQESFLELTDIEYELKDLEQLITQLESLQLDPKMLEEQLGPLTADFEEVQAQVGEYQSMIDGYKTELVSWDKTLEKQILKLEEFQGLNKYKPIDPSHGMGDAQKRLEGYQSKDFVNKQIKKRFARLLDEEGPNALAKRLTAGHEKLTEYKQKFSEIQDISKVPKKQPNPLKGKSLKERLSFGGNFQVNRQKPVTVDAGLELAYQLTPRSEWGAGAAYRLKLEKGVRPETVTDVINLKSFYHYRIWRSIGIQGNYELNYGLPRVEQALEGLSKQWTQSGLIGLRNEQPFFKNLGGYVTMQYDFLHKPESPNPRWVFRFGFRLN
jgi:hypothetical protein